MTLPHPHAFIFDMDGTILDNMDLHHAAFGAFMARRALPAPSIELRARLDGKRNREIFPILLDRELGAEELRAFSIEKETLYRELAAGALRPVAGLARLFAAMAARAIPAAIATSAPAENVAQSLDLLDLHRHFRAVVRGDEVVRGKPAPDIFLEAARRLGVAPAHCLVFEDAFMGIEGAKAAGMACVALTTTNSAESLRAHGGADFVVADFDDFLAGPGSWLLG